MSNVFGVEVYTGELPNSAALGAAFRACHGFAVDNSSPPAFVSFDSVIGPRSKAFAFQLAAKPNANVHSMYLQMAERYSKLEQAHVKLI